MWPKFGFRKLEKWQWRQFVDMTSSSSFFWHSRVSLDNFSYWSKFYVYIVTGSGVTTIFIYKGLTRIPIIGNTLVWVLPNTWRLGWVMVTELSTNVCNILLLNAAKCQGVTCFTLSELLKAHSQVWDNFWQLKAL